MSNTSSKRCPMCKRARTEQFAPFCSQRCKDRDLAQWFGDGYAVPGEPVDPEVIASRDWDTQE